MPIIVDEVVISVEVTRAEPAAGAPGAALSAEERRALVSECAERVLDILERREER